MNWVESVSHPAMPSRRPADLSPFAAQLASLPEDKQEEEDKPAAEEEASEDQGEGFRSRMHFLSDYVDIVVENTHCFVHVDNESMSHPI